MTTKLVAFATCIFGEEWNKLAPQRVFVSATPGKWEKEHSDSQTELLVRPTGLVDPRVEIKPATHQVEDVLEEANNTTKKGYRTLITTLTKKWLKILQISCMRKALKLDICTLILIQLRELRF